jgi:hypothetical protein
MPSTCGQDPLEERVLSYVDFVRCYSPLPAAKPLCQDIRRTASNTYLRQTRMLHTERRAVMARWSV